MAIHQIVHVVAMGNGFVPAVRPMNMARFVTAAAMRGCACVWVGLRDGDRVLIDMPLMGVVQMPVMEVVDVPVMHDGLVATVGSVNMVV